MSDTFDTDLDEMRDLADRILTHPCLTVVDADAPIYEQMTALLGDPLGGGCD